MDSQGKPVATFMFIAGFILALAGGIWLVLTIFMESVLWGLLSLLLPIVSLVFVAQNWDQCKTPFLTQVVGIGLVIGSYAFA